MEHFWCWAKPTIIYVIAFIIIEILNYLTLRNRVRSAYLRGRIDIMKEYCDKMEQIDHWHKEWQQIHKMAETVIEIKATYPDPDK